MDKNNEQKKNTNPETNQKQDNLKPWLKLLPAAAVFAAVCVTCYQTEKSPVETAVVSNNSIMSTNDIKELIATGNTHDEALKESSAKISKASAKTSKKSKKASKIKTGTKKNASTGAAANGSAAGGGGAGSTVTPTTQVPTDGYVDGTYTGSGTGFGGTITVQVTVSNHKIASINILDASSETASYFANAQSVVSRIISSQSPNVDAVSGATYSSNGIRTHCLRRFHQETRQQPHQHQRRHQNLQRNQFQHQIRIKNLHTKMVLIREQHRVTAER